VHALNPRGDVVRVLIDPGRGRILAMGPAQPPPNGRMPPDSRVGALPPDYGNNDGAAPPTPPRGVPNAQQRPGADHRVAAATPVRPPMPRPRPADLATPAAAVKPAPDAPAAAPAAETPPTPPAETPPQTDGPAPAGSAFPPVAPLD
jgi:hypothetical protein